MNKSHAIWLLLMLLLVSAEACGSHESDTDKPTSTPTDSRTAPTAPTRISVATANAYVRTIRSETKAVRAIVDKWDADTTAAASPEELKRIAIDEGPSLGLAVEQYKKVTDLWTVVMASFPTPCTKSASIIDGMAQEDLAVDVEKNNLLIQSDISTAAGVARLHRARVLLDAKEQAIVDKKNAYMESAEYKNACGPDD
jgi:hypothetical protein